MKTFARILLAVLVAAACPVYGQSVFLKYGPVAGIQKSTGLDYHNTAAASSDVIGLWSGCSGANFLRGDGTCAVPAGTGVTSVSQTVPAGFAIAGSPITSSGTLAISYATGQTANRVLATPDGTTGALSLRALVAGDIPPINLGSTANGGVSSATILLGTNGGTSNGFFSITGPATSLKTFTFPNASATVLTTNAAVTVAQGGTSLATLTANGVMVGEGTSAPNFVVMGADTVLRGTASADPVAAAVPNCGSSTTALNYNTTTHAFGCQTISAAGTGTVTNVASGTGITGGPITTTGTLSVDQSFSPTWTGLHTFTPSGTSVPLTINHNSGASNDFLITGSGAGAVRAQISNNTNSNGAYSGLDLTDSAGSTFAMHLLPPATGSGAWTGGPTGEQMAFGSAAAAPLSIATSNLERVRVASAGNVTINKATSGVTLTVGGVSNARTAVFTAGTTSGQSFGPEIDAGTNSSDEALKIFNQAVSLTYLTVRGDGQVFMPQLTNTSAAQTGTVCWSSAAGQLTVDTTVACLSSTLRVKQAVQPLDIGLRAVMRLRPVSYDLKPEFNPEHLGRQVGLIAEEVQKVDPRLVALDGDGQPRGVRYMQMTAVLVKAIQQQQRELYALWATLAISVGLTFYRTRRCG